MNKTQAVREYLEKVGKITSWEAIMKFRATRLSSIIHNLRHTYCMPIQTIMVKPKNGKDYAEYVLVKEEQ